MRIALLALATLVGGCHWNLNDPGTDPKATQLYFPSGIAMDPGGRYAYIANGNADLKFGGGTVMVADMLVFECTVARYRQLHPLHPLHAGDVALPLPTLCGDPTNYDAIIEGAKCLPDPIDPTIVDCDEKAFLLPNATVRIGNFAGGIRIHRIDDKHRDLFVVVRGDPSITKIKVDLGKDLTKPGVLNCFNNVDSLTTRKGYDPVKNETIAPPPCDADFLIQEYTCQNQPSCQLGKDNMGLTQLATEPFGMELDEANHRLLVSHLATGQVSLINIDLDPKLALRSISDPFFPPDPLGRHGAFSLAQQNPSDRSSLWYLTSSVNPQVATFRVGRSDVIIPSFAFGIATSFAQGTDGRDIHFEPGGQRAFMTENNPPSVIVLDTSPRTDGSGGTPVNTVRDIIDVCQTPSHMGIRRIDRPGAPGTPTQRSTRLVVVCFLSSQLMIVDPDRPGVNDTIFSGFGGPNDIAFNFLDDGATPADEALPPRPRRAYVTNYSESTVALVDFEPGSPSENRVIGRLGFPPDGFQP